MNRTLRILCAMLLLAAAAIAQEKPGETFKCELKRIMDEAKTGFPTSRGGVTAEDGYGISYVSSLSFFGSAKDASIYFEKELDSKYTGFHPEAFYFTQYFSEKTANGKYISENGEALFDEIADALGLKKVKVKQSKAMRDNFREVAYKKDGAMILSIVLWLKGGRTDLKVYSPYRPQDVKTPNLLGCIVFKYAHSGFLSVVPVYGAALGDKEKVITAAYAASGLTEHNYQYEWMPGTTPRQVEQKWGKQTSVTVMNAYTVE